MHQNYTYICSKVIAGIGKAETEEIMFITSVSVQYKQRVLMKLSLKFAQSVLYITYTPIE